MCACERDLRVAELSSLHRVANSSCPAECGIARGKLCEFGGCCGLRSAEVFKQDPVMASDDRGGSTVMEPPIWAVLGFVNAHDTRRWRGGAG
jgi:hypothetical protein